MQQFRPADEGQREPQPLALATGQAAERGGRHRAQAQHVHQLVRVAGIGMEARVLHDGLAGSRPQVDAAGLEHQADAGSQRPATARRILPEDPHRAGVGAAIAFDDLDGRGLAGAVRAKDGHELARGHRHRDVVKHRPLAIALADLLDTDGRSRHGAIRA